MSSSNSPCAACKIQRRKCTQDCVFAPYFPPDQPQKFSSVHKVYGASNVSKLLSELSTTQREDAVNSLAYEAEARLRDPVYGCVGLISILQQRLKQVQADLNNARSELASYMGPTAMIPIFPPPQVPNFLLRRTPPLPPLRAPLYAQELQRSQQQQNQNQQPPLMMQQFQYNQQQQQQQLAQALYEQQQMMIEEQLMAAAAAREQEELLSLELKLQQQQQGLETQDFISVNSVNNHINNNNVSNAGFGQIGVTGISDHEVVDVEDDSPTLALGNGSFGGETTHQPSQGMVQHGQQYQHHQFFQQQQHYEIQTPQPQGPQQYQLGFLGKLDGHDHHHHQGKSLDPSL